MRVLRSMAPGPLLVTCTLWCAFTGLAQTPPATLPPSPAPVVAAPTAPGIPDLNSNGQAQPDPAQPKRVGPDVPDLIQRPLTPAEQRDREIQKYDPLNPVNPILQDAPGQAKQPDPPRRPQTFRPEDAPLPGSVAESNATDSATGRSQGPEVVTGTDDNAALSYNGPAVLSRSYSLSRQPGASKKIRWSWTVGTSQGYQTGLVTGQNTAGAATNSNSYTTGTSFSISGGHTWRKDTMNVSYAASFGAFPGASSYGGVSQNFTLGWNHTFSRRVFASLSSASSLSPPSATLDNPLLNPAVSVANVSLATSPSTTLLYSRTRQVQLSSNLTWQRSSRLSFSIGGGLFGVDRTGAALTGNVGYQAQAEVNYRYDVKTTVGLSYSHSSYTFAQHIAVSDSNSTGIIFSRSLDRSTQLRLRAGISWTESLSQTPVVIDPVFAVLIGRASTIIDSYTRRSSSDISAQFARDLRKNRTLSISYARGVSPGNGQILTSLQQSYTAAYSMKLFRRLPFNITGGRTELYSQTATIGNSVSTFVGTGTSRSLHGGATSAISIQYGSFSVSGMPGLRSQLGITSSINWGPGPGKIW